jgi:outer membrane usher protein
MENQRTKVFGGAVNVGGLWGELEATMGVADVDSVGTRWLGGLGYRYVTLDYNVGLRWVQTQEGFRLPGDTDFDPTPARTVTLNGGARLSDRWSAGAAWLEIDRRSDRLDTRSINMSATYSVSHRASVLFAYNRVSEGGISRNIGTVLLSVALGNQSSATAGVDFGSSPRQFVGAQRALPFDEGWGYRALASRDSNGTRIDAAAALNLRAATVSAEIVNEPGLLAGRAGVAGSVALIEDKPFLAREITDSFALVRVPGIAGAPILLDNQAAGVTDEAGRLVLPRLTPYVPHQVRVDVDALPADAEIVRDRETVVPPFRSGVVVTLGVQRTAAALVKVVDGSGRPLPTGAAVSIEPDGSATSVAQGGAFFVRANAGRKRATVTARGEKCAVEFELVPGDVGAYRTLGPYTCAP